MSDDQGIREGFARVGGDYYQSHRSSLEACWDVLRPEEIVRGERGGEFIALVGGRYEHFRLLEGGVWVFELEKEKNQGVT